MKIFSDKLLFESLIELTDFMETYKAQGFIKFIQPLEDKSGSVLVKEEIPVKESVIRKLEEMQGTYKPEFHVKLTKDLLAKIREILGQKFLKEIEQADYPFIRHLYDSTPVHYKGVILNAVQGRRFLLALFQTQQDNPTFFRYCVQLGLLSLGIVLSLGSVRMKFLRRYAFLGGLGMDLARINSKNYSKPIESDEEKVRLAQQCGNFLQTLYLPNEVVAAVLDHPPLNAYKSEIRDVQVESESEDVDLKAFDQVLEEEELPEEFEDLDDPPSQDINEELANVVAEVLKIARYIQETVYRIQDDEYQIEELVYYLAYNSAKGFLSENLTKHIVDEFQEFEVIVKRLRKIAEIEKECRYPPSAWAYPKPKATQVLCRKKVWDCPLIVQGWDINVIQSQEGYGYIGVTLPQSHYPKCRLEEKLEDIES